MRRKAFYEYVKQRGKRVANHVDARILSCPKCEIDEEPSETSRLNAADGNSYLWTAF